MPAFLTIFAFSFVAFLLVSTAATSPRLTRIAVWLTPVGALLALATHLYGEGLTGTGSFAADWPSYPQALGAPPYISDALTAGLGAWCLALGTVILFVQAYREQQSSTHNIRVSGLVGSTIAVLYATIHTTNLLLFAVEMLVLVALLWAIPGAQKNAHEASYSAHSTLALGSGALCVLAAALIVGRTTGGSYDLGDLSLSALNRGTLALIVLGVAFWAGLLPFTGWSTRVGGINGLLVRSLVAITPALVLVLRLQELVTNQGFAGTAPDGWTTLMSLLLWAGAITAITGGAGAWVHAGTNRCLSSLAASASGLTMWGLGLDSPSGRYAAVAIALAAGTAVVALWLADAASDQVIVWYPALALGGLPLTASFVGVWLMAGAITETGRLSAIVPLLGAVILACMGAAIHAASITRSNSAENRAGLTSVEGASAALAVCLLLVGGVVPGAWLPLAANIAAVSGGTLDATYGWYGLQVRGSTTPLVLIGIGAVLVALLGRLIGAWMRSRAVPGTLLLPPAIALMGRTLPTEEMGRKPTPSHVPAPVWWMSFTWLDEGVWGLGVLLGRVGSFVGIGLGRLEGRYYLPLALLLVMAAILAITH